MRILPLFVVFPLFGSFLITLLNACIKKDKVRYFLNDLISNLIVVFLFILSVFLFGKKGVYFIGGWRIPFGINFVFDYLTSIMLIIVNLIGSMCVIFSIDYMKRYTAKRYYYALFLLMLAGMNGVILTGDFFNMYVFIEIASISSYALVAFGTEREELEASFKYMVMGSLATGFILFGIAIIYSKFGMLNMVLISKEISKGIDKLTKLSFFLLLSGFLIKAAAVPFHSWLPDAHPSAPAPISAMLSGVLIKTLGIYPIIRIMLILPFSINKIIVYLGILSMIVGVILALGQMDMKRLFAYHSISQIGYILLGIGLATPLGIIGGVFHLLNHSLFKSLLFLTSGAVYYRIGTRDLKEMGGLKEVMPVTATSSLIGSLSISGLPPFNGFFSKLIIIVACVKAGHPIYALWAVIGSILTLSSFMKVQRFAFYGERRNFKDVKEVPFSMKFSMVFLAVLCLVSSILVFPEIRKNTLDKAVTLLNKMEYWSILK